jgi:hypothetical protein
VLRWCYDAATIPHERPVNAQQLATNRRRIDAVPFLCCHKLTLSFPTVFSVVVSRRGPLLPYFTVSPPLLSLERLPWWATLFRAAYNCTEFLRENRLSCEILVDTDREMDLVCTIGSSNFETIRTLHVPTFASKPHASHARLPNPRNTRISLL